MQRGDNERWKNEKTRELKKKAGKRLIGETHKEEGEKGGRKECGKEKITEWKEKAVFIRWRSLGID